MNTIENNKIIAEFMGAKTDINVYHEIGSRMGKFDLWIPKHGIVVISRLKYNSDWNWLMEVISKINEIEEVYGIEEFLVIRDEVCTGRIETTYHSVVEFIKWHNENN